MIKKSILALITLSTTACSSGNMTPQVKRDFAECEAKYPDQIGNYANQSRCKTTAAVSSYIDRGRDAIPLAKLGEKQIAIWQQVDNGTMSVDEAKERIKLLDAESKAQGEHDSSIRSRRAWGAALMGASAGMQGFSNGYTNSVRQNQYIPSYQSPTQCITQPSGGGFVTSCNH